MQTKYPTADGKTVEIDVNSATAEQIAVLKRQDASREKHLPVAKVLGNKVAVSVGSVLHPSEPAHHIAFVYVETERGGQRKALATGAEPKAEFVLDDDKAIAVFAYCNLHGLWKVDV